MSNDWFETTTDNGITVPIAPGHPAPGANERPWTGPGTTYPRPRHRRRTSPVFIWAIVIGGLLAILAGGIILRSSGAVPAAVPVVGADPGVTACKTIASGRTITGAPDTGQNQPMTDAQYKKLRATFAGSRYPDIRDNGTKLLDLIWQMQSMTTTGTDADDASSSLALLPLMGPLTQAYSGLAGGCAAQGYTIPTLGS